MKNFIYFFISFMFMSESLAAIEDDIHNHINERAQMCRDSLESEEVNFLISKNIIHQDSSDFFSTQLVLEYFKKEFVNFVESNPILSDIDANLRNTIQNQFHPDCTCGNNGASSVFYFNTTCYKARLNKAFHDLEKGDSCFFMTVAVADSDTCKNLKHALCLELKKQNDDSLIYSIHNSGFSVPAQNIVETPSGYKFVRPSTYQITPDHIDDFLEKLSELMPEVNNFKPIQSFYNIGNTYADSEQRKKYTVEDFTLIQTHPSLFNTLLIAFKKYIVQVLVQAGLDKNKSLNYFYTMRESLEQRNLDRIKKHIDQNKSDASLEKLESITRLKECFKSWQFFKKTQDANDEDDLYFFAFLDLEKLLDGDLEIPIDTPTHKTTSIKPETNVPEYSLEVIKENILYYYKKSLEYINDKNVLLSIVNYLGNEDRLQPHDPMIVAYIIKQLEDIVNKNSMGLSSVEKNEVQKIRDSIHFINYLSIRKNTLYIYKNFSLQILKDKVDNLTSNESCAFLVSGSGVDSHKKVARHAIGLELEKTDADIITFYIHNSGYATPEKNCKPDPYQKLCKSSVYPIPSSSLDDFLSALVEILPSAEKYHAIESFYDVAERFADPELTEDNTRYRWMQKGGDCMFEGFFAFIQDKCQRDGQYRGFNGENLAYKIRQYIYESAQSTLTQTQLEKKELLRKLLRNISEETLSPTVSALEHLEDCIRAKKYIDSLQHDYAEKPKN